nr:hypothetical protein [Streptomyces sp. DSM 41633]
FSGPSSTVHAFTCTGELPVYTRSGVPDSPLRLSDAPPVIAEVAALVELRRAVGDTWTVHLDEGWVQPVPSGPDDPKGTAWSPPPHRSPGCPGARWRLMTAAAC